MSLKTPETRLRELGLGEYFITYDDEENEPSAIAWLSKEGVELGHWNSDLEYFPKTEPRNFRALYHLTAIVEECRAKAGYQSSDYENTLRQMRADNLRTQCRGEDYASSVDALTADEEFLS